MTLAVDRPTDGCLIVDDAVGDMHPSPYAYAIVALCGLIAMAEGYDAQAMAFAAPLVARTWGLSPQAMGALLAASIAAMVISGFLLASLGDRWGRRPAIIGALALAAVATAAGAVAPGYGWLLASRIVAGLGLGLAFPTVIALAMEVMPRRLQPIVIVIVSCGYPVGGAVGGGIAALLIADHGAPAIFLLGGATTAILCLLCITALPESPLWLAAQTGSRNDMCQLLMRLGATIPTGTVSFSAREKRMDRWPVTALFTRARRMRTSLLSLLNFANLSLVYFYIIWLPTILVNAGRSPAFAASALAQFSAAGVVGGLTLAFVLRRWGTGSALSAAYLGAIALITLMALTPIGSGAFLPVLFGAGLFVVGSQFCLNAVVNQSFPSIIRATASGFTGGAGRLGALAAPLVGAALVRPGHDHVLVMATGVVPAGAALLALIGLLLLAPPSAAPEGDDFAAQPVDRPMSK